MIFGHARLRRCVSILYTRLHQPRLLSRVYFKDLVILVLMNKINKMHVLYLFYLCIHDTLARPSYYLLFVSNNRPNDLVSML
jgi:hypothetical protein